MRSFEKKQYPNKKVNARPALGQTLLNIQIVKLFYTFLINIEAPLANYKIAAVVPPSQNRK